MGVKDRRRLLPLDLYAILAGSWILRLGPFFWPENETVN